MDMQATQERQERMEAFMRERFNFSGGNNTCLGIPQPTRRVTSPMTVTDLVVSYDFTSTLTNLSSPILVLDDNRFYIVGVDHPSTTRLIYTKLVTPPPLINNYFAGEDEIDHTVEFHGSTAGLICLTIDHSGHIIWNPLTGKCIEFPMLECSFIDKASTNTHLWNPNTASSPRVLKPDTCVSAFSYRILIYGMGDAGEGDLHVACIGTTGCVPDVSVPITINLLSLRTGKWTVVETNSVFLGDNPCYIGVAKNVLLWAYPYLNPKCLSGYDFRTRTVIHIDTPPLGPPLLAPESPFPTEDDKLRLFAAADYFWALGENREENYLRRYEGGQWVNASNAFEIQESAGMVESLLGSSLDFTRFLISCSVDNLLLLHLGSKEIEFPITLVDTRIEDEDEDDSDTDSADTVGDTYSYTDLRCIQFRQSFFFPAEEASHCITTIVFDILQLFGVCIAFVLAYTRSLKRIAHYLAKEALCKCDIH
ncbi:hypothetical protein KSS87_001069 [Heliosperma pusillum]|nr:hypothetical protein KSS87_001069 [Heliosperma pusillum]